MKKIFLITRDPQAKMILENLADLITEETVATLDINGDQ